MQAFRLRRTLLIFAGATAALLLVAGASIYWLTATQPGFRYLLGLAQRVPGVTIAMTGISGVPASGFAVERLVIDHERVRIEIDDLRARVNPVFLLGRTISFAQLEATTVRVHVKPRVRPPDHMPPRFLPSYLRVALDDARVGRLDVDAQGSALFAATALRAAAAITSGTIHLAQASVDAGAYRASGSADLSAADPLGVGGTVELVVPLANDQLAARAVLSGNLDRLHVELVAARPGGVRYVGDIALVDTPRLDGIVTLAAADLAPLLEGGTLGRIDARLAVSGNLGQFSVEGPATVPALAPGGLTVSLLGRYQDDTLYVTRAGVAAGASGPEITASGSLRLKPEFKVDGDLGWRRLRWPLTGKPAVESVAGAAHVAGAGAYAYTVNGDLRGPGLPVVALAAQGSIRDARVEVARLSARLLGGEVLAAGSASWHGAREWRFDASGRQLDPGRLRPQLAGRVSFSAAGSGRGYDPQGDWQASLASLTGQIRGKPVSGSGLATMRHGELSIAQAHVSLASLKAAANGGFGGQSALELTATLGNLGDFLDDASGSASLRASYAAHRGEQKLNGSLDAQHLHRGALNAASVSARADIDTASREPSSFALAARGITGGGGTIDAIDIAANGLAAHHTITAAVQSGERRLSLDASGAYLPTTRGEELEIGSVSLDAPKLARFVLSRPSAARLDPVRGTLERTCVGNGESQACIGGDWRAGGSWNAAADLTRLPLGLVPLPVPAGTQYSGFVTLSVAASGRPGAPVTGHASADLDGIDLRYQVASGRHAGLTIGTGRITAVAGESAATLNADVRTTADSYLSLQASAQRDPARALGEAPLSGRLRVRTRELDFLPIVVRDLDRVSGLLEADLRLEGTIGAPLVDGTLALTDAAADIYLSNLRLKQVAATVGLHGHALELDASALAGTGQLAAKGALSWDGGRLNGTMHFTGDKLLVANLPEARVVASPDVTLTLAANRIEVRGEIQVPAATIAPKDLSTAVRVSSDQAIVGAQRGEDGSQLSVDSQVKVTLGPDVHIAAYGLKGLLAGTIFVVARPDELVTGSGELEIRDGHYLAYARELDIERGRLIFRGGPVDNAGLDIRASKKLPGYTAGVNVRGTLQAPQISFFSDPSLPQSQIASLLIVGQTTNVGQGGAGNLLMAQGGALLVGDYTQHLGIDQMTIEADPNNGTALVLGKFLSPRLYVSYGISLAQAINTLKLRYTIGDNWVINTESGLNHSADVQYSFQR